MAQIKQRPKYAESAKNTEGVEFQLNASDTKFVDTITYEELLPMEIGGVEHESKTITIPKMSVKKVSRL